MAASTSKTLGSPTHSYTFIWWTKGWLPAVNTGSYCQLQNKRNKKNTRVRQSSITETQYNTQQWQPTNDFFFWMRVYWFFCLTRIMWCLRSRGGNLKMRHQCNVSSFSGTETYVKRRKDNSQQESRITNRHVWMIPNHERQGFCRAIITFFFPFRLVLLCCYFFVICGWSRENVRSQGDLGLRNGTPKQFNDPLK